MASNNLPNNLTPAERDEEKRRLRDLPTGAEHKLPAAKQKQGVKQYDDQFFKANPDLNLEPRAFEVRDYDQAFFNYGKKDQAEPLQNILGQTGIQTAEALKYEYFIPNRFEKGDHLSKAVIEGRLMGVSLLSNATFKDVMPGQKADIGVATARFSPDRVDATLTNFHIQSSEDRQELPKLLLKSRQMKQGLEAVDKSGEKIEQLKITLDLEKKLLQSKSLGKGARCYVLRGKSIYEVTSVSDMDLKTDDIVFAATEGVIKSLVRNVSRNFVEQPLRGKYVQEEAESFNYQKDYTDSEAANQVKGLLDDSSTVGEGLGLTKLLMSPTDLHNKITEIYKKRYQIDQRRRIVTDAFFVYQIP
jgi:hypothetical protein